MSSTLYWRPAPKDVPPAESLPFELKKAIARRFWDHDGSLHGEEIEVDTEGVPYLEGLSDAGVDGADELLQAIREHGRVLLWIGS